MLCAVCSMQYGMVFYVVLFRVCFLLIIVYVTLCFSKFVNFAQPITKASAVQFHASVVNICYGSNHIGCLVVNWSWTKTSHTVHTLNVPKFDIGEL